jgi:hypothetical protein
MKEVEQNETKAYSTTNKRKEKASNSRGNVLLGPRENVRCTVEEPRKSGRKMA